MKPEKYIAPSAIKWCVIIPTYNNAGTLFSVLSETLKYADHVIVINDGSTDETAEIIASFGNKIESIHYSENTGKGFALRQGFKRAVQRKFTHAITIDSDGQHLPSDIPLFIDHLNHSPGSLVIGARNMQAENVPGKSNFGNKFSNFWFRVETGIRLEDTQSGFRLYPLYCMDQIRFLGTKFEFEVEVIVKAAWAEIPTTNIPIGIHYEPREKRISHFRPFRDFSRISILNTYLVVLALCYYIPIRLFKGLTIRELGRFLRKQFLDKEETTKTKALSVGFGVFMGIFPVWGYQIILGLILAKLLKLNKAIFLVAANISIPPMIPFILYSSYQFGGMFFPQDDTYLMFSDGINLEMVKQNVSQYIIGSVSLAMVCGVFFGLLSYGLIKFYRSGRYLSKKDKQPAKSSVLLKKLPFLNFNFEFRPRNTKNCE